MKTKTARKRTVKNPEMAWQPHTKMWFCETCKHCHPHYFRCKEEKK